MITLEKEFEITKHQHKLGVLKKVITKFYEDLQGTNTVNIPDFLRNDTPDKLADLELWEILNFNDGGVRFEYLYNKAWEQISESLV